jgi:DNA polymerase-3 subunit epsilon
VDQTGPWPEGELLGFDLETTGVDRFSDVPVSFALVRMEAGVVIGCDASLVDPGREIPTGAVEVHGISTERARAEGIPLADAFGRVSDALLDASNRGVPVVGMNLSYDLTILDVQCRGRTGLGLGERGWGGPALDALTLDRQVDKYRKGKRRLENLCLQYEVELAEAHEASADAEAAVRVVVAMATRYLALRDTPLADLHAAQILWHREWALSLDDYRAKNGQTPLDPSDYIWPIAWPIARSAVA